jgi:lipoate-protein ligase A
LLKLETHDGYANMAIDEAILTAKIRKLVPNTIRFYRWNPSAVSVGKFQNIENEVHLDNCRKLGVDVVRRITGGGAVYHDTEDEITYSMVVGKQDLQTQDITAIYGRIYAGLAEALKLLGVTADFNEGDAKNCPNLTVKGKKISGSAQSHKSGVVLQHGTLLLDVDLERMFTFLRVPWATTCMQIVDVAKSRITSVDKELGRRVSEEEACESLVKGFQKAFSTQFCQGELTAYERELAQRLAKEKYATKEWSFEGKSLLR